jgi:hypothetical protein
MHNKCNLHTACYVCISKVTSDTVTLCSMIWCIAESIVSTFFNGTRVIAGLCHKVAVLSVQTLIIRLTFWRFICWNTQEKIKVKLSLCLTCIPWRCMGSGCILIDPLDRRLDGYQSWYGWCGEEKILHLTETWTATPQIICP